MGMTVVPSSEVVVEIACSNTWQRSRAGGVIRSSAPTGCLPSIRTAQAEVLWERGGWGITSSQEMKKGSWAPSARWTLEGGNHSAGRRGPTRGCRVSTRAPGAQCEPSRLAVKTAPQIYQQNLENLQKWVFCGLSRSNTENIAVIFGEENQFCIVSFNLNKMWILLKKKKDGPPGPAAWRATGRSPFVNGNSFPLQSIFGF